MFTFGAKIKKESPYFSFKMIIFKLQTIAKKMSMAFQWYETIIAHSILKYDDITDMHGNISNGMKASLQEVLWSKMISNFHSVYNFDKISPYCIINQHQTSILIFIYYGTGESVEWWVRVREMFEVFASNISPVVRVPWILLNVQLWY